MSNSDPLGDMLTRIRNGQMANLSVVDCPSSLFRKRVLEVMQREGYIRGFTEVQKGKTIPVLHIELKYHEGEGASARSTASPSRAVACMPVSRILNACSMAWVFRSYPRRMACSRITKHVRKMSAAKFCAASSKQLRFYKCRA